MLMCNHKAYIRLNYCQKYIPLKLVANYKSSRSIID